MNQHVRVVLLAVLGVCASLLMAPAGAAHAASGGTISGTVTAPGLPAGTDVSVEVQRRLPSGHWVAVNRGTYTSVGDRYTLRIADTGTYRLQALDFDQTSSSDFRTVSVSKGVKRTGVNLSLQPNREITGRVATEGFTSGGLDPDMPLMVAADTTREPSWSTEVAATASVSADGSYTLSVPRPYSTVRVRFYQRPCPDDPALGCELGVARVVSTAFWNGATYGASTFEQATPVDLSAGSAVAKDVTLRLAKQFSSTTKPRITGTPRLGATLTAHPGAYAPSATSVVYEWYAGTADLLGEYDSLVGTGRTFTVTSNVIGDSLMVRARPVREGYEGSNLASAYVLAKSRSSLAVKAEAGKRKATFSVRVKAPGLDTVRIYGKASVYAKGKRIKTVTVRNGKATIKIAKQKKGKRTYTIRWSGNDSITSAKKGLKVRIR